MHPCGAETRGTVSVSVFALFQAPTAEGVVPPQRPELDKCSNHRRSVPQAS
jgi:hypothetical protein